MSNSVLIPYNKVPQYQLATVLLVGSEGLGKHGFGKCLIKNTWFYLQVRTATTLPLPVTSDSSRPRIDYICFLIDLTSRDSLKTVEESLKHVDVRYFLGKCCFVALKVKNPEKRAIFIEQIAQLSQQYKSDVLYGSFETEAESAFLAEQILKSVEIAAGLQKNKSPMFLECCRFPVAGEESAEWRSGNFWTSWKNMFKNHICSQSIGYHDAYIFVVWWLWDVRVTVIFNEHQKYNKIAIYFWFK